MGFCSRIAGRLYSPRDRYAVRGTMIERESTGCREGLLTSLARAAWAAPKSPSIIEVALARQDNKP